MSSEGRHQPLMESSTDDAPETQPWGPFRTTDW
jgi:hypothetical protein